MGGPRMFLLLLLIASFPITLGFFEGKTKGKQCIQCVAGKFLQFKWLLVDKHINQQINWKEEWEDTDCLEEEVNIIRNCRGPCITIKVRPFFDSGFTTDGILMDCSDSLIIDTRDFHMEYGRGYGKTKTAQRDNHQIVYEWFQFDSHNTTALAEHFLGLIPHHRKIKTTTASKVVYAIVGSLIVFAVISGCYFARPLCCKMGEKYRVHLYPGEMRNNIRMRDIAEFDDSMMNESGISGSSGITHSSGQSQQILEAVEDIPDNASSYVPIDFNDKTTARARVLTYMSDDSNNTFYNLNGVSNAYASVGNVTEISSNADDTVVNVAGTSSNVYVSVGNVTEVSNNAYASVGNVARTLSNADNPVGNVTEILNNAYASVGNVARSSSNANL